MSDAAFDSNNNYCTDWFDRIPPLHLDWSHCCYQHDLDYTHLINKFVADWHLVSCVISTNGPLATGFAILMWLGVTIFGVFYYLRALLKRGASGRE